jgi:hypothetical protein
MKKAIKAIKPKAFRQKLNRARWTDVITAWYVSGVGYKEFCADNKIVGPE